MTTDIDKPRELDNDEIIMALKDFSSQIRIRIKLDYMPYISKSEIEVSRLVGDAATALEAANKRIAELEGFPTVEFHQWDWIEGFAAFVDDGQKFNPESKAFCVLNLGSLLAAIETKDLPHSELAYHIADSMMHEITHVIEKWAGVEFSEERVVGLRDKYRGQNNG